MSQLIYSPFGALQQLHRELGRAFDDRSRPDREIDSYESQAWTPQVDIKEDDKGFSVLTDLPGIDPSRVEVTVDRNVLTIRGTRETEITGDDGSYKRRERVTGPFVRQFTLPEVADGASVTAKSVNGVLEVRIPKGERHQPLNIAIES